MPDIEVRGIHKRFGDVRAVSDVSFSVEKGDFFGLLGPNGAGKTTTISMLTGLARRVFESGTVTAFDSAQLDTLQALLREEGSRRT